MVSYLFYGEKIDAQAMLLRVGKSLEAVDVSWFSAFMSPLQVVDRLVREFGYFDDDLNILKLLEFAGSFSHIPTFIEEFDSSSISVASNTIHGAKIMTIHGSKGLEFEYVILLDKLTKPNPDTSALVFHYDDSLYIDKIYYRSKGRENFDTSYARMLEERKISTLKDKKNVLYVALTRAVEGLIVLRKPKDSIFDELGMEVMGLGNLQQAQIHDTTKAHPLNQEDIKITSYGTQEAVKQEEEGEKDYEAILFGTALHYTLEMLGTFDEVHLAHAMTALQNKYGQQLNKISMEQIRERVSRLIEHANFLRLLEGAKVRKEQSLSFEGEIKQIDLLLEYHDYNLVIDYKSSKKYALKHQQQVGYYKKAIANITGKHTQGAIVYLLEEGIEIVLS
jgi:exodeoxyribonuclease V beta subunit